MTRPYLTALATGLILFAIGGNTAIAQTRDQVMSDAFRCGSYENTRDWLDCYYGAAKSIRATLRVAPPTQRQLQLVAAPPTVGPPVPDRAVRDQVMAGATRCAATDEDRNWLDCYYASAQRVRALLGLAPAPQASAASSGAVDGLTTTPRTYPVSDRSPVRMQGYAFDNHGWFTVTLINGQVWQQVTGDTDYAHWNLPAQKYAVRFAPGFMGSTNMRVIGHGGSYKVIRLR